MAAWGIFVNIGRWVSTDRGNANPRLVKWLASFQWVCVGITELIAHVICVELGDLLDRGLRYARGELPVPLFHQEGGSSCTKLTRNMVSGRRGRIDG
jgi:hypothetical protein